MEKNRIAVISLTMNDHYKIKEWRKWFDEYKEDVDSFIIVDNNSENIFQEELRSIFPEATIIELGYNGGCTGAYNCGISKALSDKNITHIALVGNDIRLEKGALKKCVEILEENEVLGMVAPVLLNADSDIVGDYGCSISKNLTLIPYGIGMKYGQLGESFRYCDAVTGGMNVSKRSFYETVGLQDNKLFMYSDEVDMGIRAKKSGFALGVTKEAKSWHQHINPGGASKRLPFSSYLISRNKVYLARKHFGLLRAVQVFFVFVAKSFKGLCKSTIRRQFDWYKDYNWMLIGAAKGLFNDMRPNRYSSL